MIADKVCKNWKNEEKRGSYHCCFQLRVGGWGERSSGHFWSNLGNEGAKSDRTQHGDESDRNDASDERAKSAYGQ